MVIFPVPGILPPFCHAGAARGKRAASHNMEYENFYMYNTLFFSFWFCKFVKSIISLYEW